MRSRYLAVALGAVLWLPVAGTVYAADSKPTGAPAQPPAHVTVPLQVDLGDLQVLILATANAGAACDQKVPIYCQLVGARDATMAKLQDAAQRLNALSTPAPAPAAKK